MILRVVLMSVSTEEDVNSEYVVVIVDIEEIIVNKDM